MGSPAAGPAALLHPEVGGAARSPRGVPLICGFKMWRYAKFWSRPTETEITVGGRKQPDAATEDPKIPAMMGMRYDAMIRLGIRHSHMERFIMTYPYGDTY